MKFERSLCSEGLDAQSLVVVFVLALINDVITPNAVNSANSPDDSLSSNCEGAFRFEITI